MAGGKSGQEIGVTDNMNRWLYVITGVLAMLFTGIMNAWTVMSSFLSASHPEWTKGALSWTFTMTMFCFCIGSLAGGLLQKKMKERTLMIAGAFLYLAGMLLASRAEALVLLYVGFGLLTGLGAGLSYNLILSCSSKWFPDRQGLVSGLLMMGFGMGGFLGGKIFTAMASGEDVFRWKFAMLVFGIAVFVILLLSSFLLKKPEPGWKPEGMQVKKDMAPACYEELTTGEMLRRPNFWIMLLWCIFMAACGLAMLSQGASMVQAAVPSVSMSQVATVVGLFSILNGAGRIFFGWFFDRVGRFVEMLTGGLVFIAAVLLFLLSLRTGSMVILTVSFCLMGFGYGVVNPSLSAVTSRFFGMQHFPENFSVMNMCLLAASFAPALAGSLFDKSGSCRSVALAVLGLAVIATILSCFIRTPGKTKK